MAKQRAARRRMAHRGVKIVELADGRFVARWTDPLSRQSRQQSLDKLGLTNADRRHQWAVAKLAELDDIRRAITSGAVAAERATVAQAAADYLKTMANPGTHANKEIVLRELQTWLASQRCTMLCDLRPSVLMRFRDHLLSPQRNNHKASTRNRWLVVVGIFLRWAQKRGLAPLLTWESIRHACERAPEPRGEIVFLRPPELRQLLQAALRHDAEDVPGRRKIAGFLLLLVGTGMRYAEAANLTWEEVDIEAGEIRLPAGRTKTKRARQVSLRESPTVLELLQALRPEPAAGRVFAELPHGTFDTIRNRLVTDYGAPWFTAHALRRSCGTLLTNAPGIYGGASAWHSARRLGHSMQTAEACYLGQIRDLPAEAKTIEAAAGIEAVARQIVAAAKKSTVVG